MLRLGYGSGLVLGSAWLPVCAGRSVLSVGSGPARCLGLALAWARRGSVCVRVCVLGVVCCRWVLALGGAWAGVGVVGVRGPARGLKKVHSRNARF